MGNLGEESKVSESFAEAFQLRDRLTEPEKFLISSLYFSDTGQVEKATEVSKLWTQAYPRDWRPLLNLGAFHTELGQYEKAIEETKKSLDVDPDNIVGHGNLMQDYALVNRLEEARAVYQEGIKRRPDNEDIRANRYELAFLQGDVAEMERQANWASGRPGVEVFLSYQSDTEAFSGRLRRAREFSARAVESARGNDRKEAAAQWEMNGALREAEFGNLAIATRETASALGMGSNRGVQILAALALARANDSARAEKMADERQ
jgi:eukaryotic-like serine/threonine-protein kinase